jgi:hypothetical protein
MNKVTTRSDALKPSPQTIKPLGKEPGKPQGAFGDVLKQLFVEIPDRAISPGETWEQAARRLQPRA